MCDRRQDLARMNMDNQSLYDKIRNTRKALGISQVELASLLYVSRQTIANWEKGITVPDARSLEKLADVLHVSVGSLLGDVDNVTRKMNDPNNHEQTAVPEKPLTNQEIASQLSRINELYAEKMLRDEEQIETLKRYAHFGILLFLIAVLLFLLMPFVRYWYMSAKSGIAHTVREEIVTIGEP